MATYVTWPGAAGGGAAGALKTTGADVDVQGAAPPSANQVLTATSATTATWQDNNAVGLDTAGAAVSVSASAAPTGASFILVTTGATTATWQDINTLNLVNNLRINANTTNTASISSSGGGTVTDAIILGKSTTTVTGAGSANKSLVLGTGTTVSATTGSIANSVFIGQGHTCTSAASTTSGAIAIGSALTVSAGASNSVTIGQSLTNGTSNAVLIGTNGNPAMLILDPTMGTTVFKTQNATYAGTSVTLTAADVLGGRVGFSSSSAVAVTLPTGASMDAHVAITQNLYVGMTFFLAVTKTNTQGITFTPGTGFQFIGSQSMPTTCTRIMVVYRNGVNDWLMYNTN